MNDKLLDQIWGDANFKPQKETILSGETIKKNSIRKVNSDGKTVAYCRVCACELFISTNYSGTYPLCKKHRDPNERPVFSEN